jgi:hypothetical protein
MGGGTEQDDSRFQEELCNITKWRHLSRNFPLTDSDHWQMSFTEKPRPKYYNAAALILFLRASREWMKETVFQKLSKRWPEWFDGELTYATLTKGVGSLMYTAEEIIGAGSC